MFFPVINRIEQRLSVLPIKKMEFYDLIGVTSAAYSKWKNGHSSPTLDNLEKCAEVLDVSLKWLMFGGDEDIKNAPAVSGEGDDLCKLSADEWELIAAYRDLNDEGQADARKHLFVMQQSGIYKKHHKSEMVSKNA